MDKGSICVIIVMLLIIATTLQVAGVEKEPINEDSQNITKDLIQPGGTERIPIDITYATENFIPAHNQGSRDNYPVPEYALIKEPTTIMTSWYDYMPGSYASHPIRLQTDHGEGHYLTFFGQETSSATRRQYYAYVNNSLDIQAWGKVTSYDIWQGYGGIAIHPATGNPLLSWHENQGGGPYETAITFDDFVTSGPGSWQDTLLVTSEGEMEYIWPYMYVGPSPLGEEYVRIYQIANNYHNLPSGNPCEDARVMWTDVEDTISVDLSSILDIVNWSNVTVFTDWRDKSVRPFQAFAIDYNNPGKVGFIGYAAWLEGNQGDMPVDEGVFVWESYDYGETWNISDLHSDGPNSYFYKVENPGFDGAPSQLEVDVGGWHNTALYDSDGNLHGTFLQSYGWSDSQGSYYLPYFMPQAEMVWDGSGFTFNEVPELIGIDPLSGHSVPWIDIDHLFPIIGWSEYPEGFGGGGLFHENTQKQAVNLENNWMLQMWVDGTYHKLGQDGDPQYQDYIEHPIICISISPDNGEHWSEPIKLTDVHSELFDFSEQITVYPYICDHIVDLGDNWGQIYMFYMDDNDFGSSVQGCGPETGGQITYCSLKIKFFDPNDLYANAGGPYYGFTNEEIQFTGSAIGGTPEYSWHWDFGDGGTSTEEDPTHSYSSAGTYNITLTVTDSASPPNEAVDTTTATITEAPCYIEIEIFGGSGILANISNIGDETLTDIDWSITIDGGLFFLTSRGKSGVIDSLEAGESEEIHMRVLGIGLGILADEPVITVTADCAEETVMAKILFFKVFIQ